MRSYVLKMNISGTEINRHIIKRPVNEAINKIDNSAPRI